jgi:hypothetical protein
MNARPVVMYYEWLHADNFDSTVSGELSRMPLIHPSFSVLITPSVSHTLSAYLPISLYNVPLHLSHHLVCDPGHRMDTCQKPGLDHTWLR